MNGKDFVILGVIFIAIFTLFKIDIEKQCGNTMPIKKTIERPLGFKMYE